MSDASSSGFGKFVPGFDFLQSLAKGAAQSMPQMPTLNSWVAPTLSVEELDKRISELKAVQFWLDQNALALKATIQALEVQKMTLATLKGMNVSMAEVAKAFTPKPTETQAAAPRAPERAPEPPAPALESASAEADDHDKPRVGAVDPMQWWGALTQQFQEIASAALKEATTRATPDPQRSPAAAPAKSASAKPAAGQVASKAAPARKAAARKRAG